MLFCCCPCSALFRSCCTAPSADTMRQGLFTFVHRCSHFCHRDPYRIDLGVFLVLVSFPLFSSFSLFFRSTLFHFHSSLSRVSSWRFRFGHYGYVCIENMTGFSGIRKCATTNQSMNSCIRMSIPARAEVGAQTVEQAHGGAATKAQCRLQ